MSGSSPFAANSSSSHQQPPDHMGYWSWSWPDAAADTRSLPGRHEAVQHLTLPPMHTQYDTDQDIEDTTTAAPTSTRSNFLAQVLNGGADEAATQRTAASRSRDQNNHLPRPAQSPPSTRYDPRLPSPPPGRNHGYVDLTREQTPPISQERSTLRTLHYAQQPTAAESPPNTDSPSSPMPPNARRKRDATSPLFEPLSPSPKRAKRNDGSSTAAGRRGSRQGGGASSSNSGGPSNAPPRSEVEEIERIDLIDDDTPLAEALQKQRAEQVKAQQESQNGADAPPRLTSLTCVICMDTPKDLTATSCGHVFCHTCLMEALIAGEQRAGPGEPKRSQCPVCRKALSRTKTGDIIPLLLMKKALATQPRRPKAASAAATTANPAPA